MSGIKFLVSGVERSTKTTTTSKIKDALVISIDNKKYPFKVPHWNANEYVGMEHFKKTILDKIDKYKEKFGKLPKTIVFDTVTVLYSKINEYANKTKSGYEIHSLINKETLDFNSFVENTLVFNGLNVVIVAHTIMDGETARYIIPASGAFAKAGSWLGTVDNAIYIGLKGNQFYVYHKDLKYPCRSVIDELPEAQPAKEYDINKHIELMEEYHLNNQDEEL